MGCDRRHRSAGNRQRLTLIATLAAVAFTAAVPCQASDARSGPDPKLRALLIEAVAESDSFAFNSNVRATSSAAPRCDRPAILRADLT